MTTTESQDCYLSSKCMSPPRLEGAVVSGLEVEEDVAVESIHPQHER